MEYATSNVIKTASVGAAFCVSAGLARRGAPHKTQYDAGTPDAPRTKPVITRLPPLAHLRMRIADHVRGMTRGTSSGIVLDLDNPPGDPGLFGPQAVCWRVHADFPAMLAGGVSALLLQALHPLALAGVWDHSSFRTDMQGRLGRTAQFIAGTTYGCRADAERLIARVRQIHAGIQGIAPDGRPYRADDPHLLTWVHVAEVSSFMAAYLRHVNPSLSAAEQDQYYAETAHIAAALGAIAIPRSRQEVAGYIERMRPELIADARAHDVAQRLLNLSSGHLAALPAIRILTAVGTQLLPPWASAMLGLDTARLRWRALGMPAVAGMLRWSLTNSAAQRARRRMAQT
jgi:uncharacterized protein (DUF2236 family)